MILEDILAPISEDAPCGEYLKDNRTLYRGYRNAFNMAQSSFRQLVEVPDAQDDPEVVNANSENWLNLGTECRQCLAENSKDVEIFCWFTMAQLFTTDPLHNLASALTTFEAVVSQHWDSLQPTLPEKKRKGSDEQQQAVEVAEHRVKPLLQLVGDTAESGLLYMPLQMLDLVGGIDYGRFYAAEKNGTIANLKDEANAAFSSERGEVEARIVSLGQALEALTSLERTFAEKCGAVGAHAVSFRFVKESIERLVAALRFLVGDQFAHWPLDPVVESQPEAEVATSSEAVNSEEQSMSTQTTSTTNVPPVTNAPQATATVAQAVPSAAATLQTTGAVASREQALAELQAIADFFLQTEPHSPIYLLLKRAVRWGGMALPELLDELVGDNSAVHQRIEHLAGLESAEHKAALNKSVATAAPAAAPSAPVQADVKPKETSPTSSGSDSGLADIEW